MTEIPTVRPMPGAMANALSLPNLLTYGRVLAVPALVVASYLEGYVGRWLMLFVFVAASVTDFFDGYLARAWKQQSAIGRMLDPIADKLLVAAALLVLVGDDTIGGWSLLAAIVILTREIAVSGLREFLAELRVSVPVTRLARWKTTMQMVAIGFLLAGPAGDRLFPYVTYIGLLLLWVSALVTLYTGYDYFRAGIRHLLTEDGEAVKLLYFAWVRERIGFAEEEVDPPQGVATAGDLLAWLRTRGPEYENALGSRAVRVAIDRVHARPDAPLAGAREVALFPPMTGG